MNRLEQRLVRLERGDPVDREAELRAMPLAELKALAEHGAREILADSTIPNHIRADFEAELNDEGGRATRALADLKARRENMPTREFWQARMAANARCNAARAAGAARLERLEQFFESSPTAEDD